MKAIKKRPATYGVRLTAAEAEELRILCFGRNLVKAGDIFNERHDTSYSYDQFRRLATENNIKAEIYPEVVNDFIRQHHKGTPYKEMARMVNEEFGTDYTDQNMKQRYNSLKLNSGLTGRFEKGHIPASKGKTWDEFMPKESQERSRATCYKKGNVPVDHKEVGTIGIRSQHHTGKDDERKVYYIKVAEPNKWEPLHHHNWKKVHGDIPKNYVVAFVNGDSLDPREENLELVSRKVWATIKHWGLKYTNREEFEAAVLIAKGRQQINSIKQERKKRRGGRRKRKDGTQV